MKPTKEKLKEYAAISKKSNRNMKDCVKAHLVANCLKFAGHEDKFDECIEYVAECAREILNGKNGEVADDACYKMARDYFNDELWRNDEKPAKAATKASPVPDNDEDGETDDPEPGTTAEAKETPTAAKTQPDQVSLFDIAGFSNA